MEAANDSEKLRVNNDAVYNSRGEGRRIVKAGMPKSEPMSGIGKGAGFVDSGANIRGNVANTSGG